MASIIPGYTYDIFISYRHKDNKYDGWVSEFVANLRKELEATFKEDISIYFDENPHDGLLPTHQVHESLDGKLKCLVFIPIISQTYCDPKSFAWKNELLIFKKTASEDDVGLKVRIANGNVASRILPVRIHSLDEKDKNALEEAIGQLRSVDFIFRSAGVNRPLRANEDHPHDNQNKTFYRDQINKVANAVKDIISSWEQKEIPAHDHIAPSKERESITVRSKKIGFVFGLMAFMAIAAFLIYLPEDTVTPSTFPPEEKSIAILPFKNLSADEENQYFADGVMEAILNNLSRIRELRVISRNSVEQYRESTKATPAIAEELNVTNVLDGSVQRAGDKVRVSVRLIDAIKDQTVWSKEYDKEFRDIFSIQSEIAQEIARTMQTGLTKEVRENIINIPTNNLDAYDLYLKGLSEMHAYWELFSMERVSNAMKYFIEAVELDPGFSLAYTGLGQCYWLQAHYSSNPSPPVWMESIRSLKKAIELDPSNGWAYAEYGVVQHNWEWDEEGAAKSFKIAKQLMPNHNQVYIHSFWFYIKTQNCAAAENIFSELKKLNPTWELTDWKLLLLYCEGKALQIPDTFDTYSRKDGVTDLLLINNYLLNKQYPKAIELSDYWVQKSQDKVLFLPTYAVSLALAGRREEALSTLQKLKEIAGFRYVPSTSFAMIYFAVGDEKMAYDYLEKALKERDWTIHSLMYFSPFYQHRNDPKFKEIIRRSWIPMNSKDKL